MYTATTGILAKGLLALIEVNHQFVILKYKHSLRKQRSDSANRLKMNFICVIVY